MLFWDILIAFCRSVGTICVSAEAFQCAKRCFPFLLRFSDAVCAACICVLCVCQCEMA